MVFRLSRSVKLFLINKISFSFVPITRRQTIPRFLPEIPPGHAGNWVSPILCAPPTFRTGQFFGNREVFGETFEKIEPFENSKNNIKEDYNWGPENDSF